MTAYTINNKNTHLISLNTQGIRDFNKRSRLIQWLKQQRVDILFLQETHFTHDLENSIRIEFIDYDLFHSFGTRASKGCSIMFDKKINYKIINFEADKIGRYIFINVELENIS